MLKLRLRDDRERRSDRFSFLRVLQLFAAVLLCTVLGMPHANAQTAVVTAGSPNTSAGSGTVTYSASVAITGPALNSEQQINNVTYAWGSSDTCNPTSSSSTTVTAQRSSPGASSSSVGCTVTWYIYNTHTQQTTTATASGGATVNFTLGVLWSPGTITGGIMTAPQNQTSSPYVPTAVVTSSGAQLTCAVNSATATDTSTFNGSPSTTGTDTVSYAWTASAGTLGSATSASTTWTAPTTPQSSPVTLTCTISATAPAVTSPDGGTRGPSSKTATVSIYMPTMTVTGGSWSPNPADVGDIITCKATASVTPAVPGATDNVIWSSNGCYQSVDGSDPFTPYGGPSGWVYTEGSTTTSFGAFFDAPGYYLIGVSAQDTLKDSNGNTIGTVSGSGFVGGGTLADVAPPAGTYGEPGAHVIRAHTDPGGDNPNGVPAVSLSALDYTDPVSGVTPVSGVLYVVKGQSITFTAVPSPAAASFKSGEPVWGGSSGASGTSATCSVTFSTYSASSTDYKTVTVTVGTTTLTANVIVYLVGLNEQFKDPSITSHDNANIGVGEEVDCFGITFPSGIPDQGLTLALVGSLKDGEVKANDAIPGGLDLYGGYAADTFTVSVTPTSGAGAGQSTNVSIGIKAITSAAENLASPPVLLHQQNSASAGFFAPIVLTGVPNVSYSSIAFLEEDALCTGSGMFASLNGLDHLHHTTSLVLNADLPSAGVSNSGGGQWTVASTTNNGDEVYFHATGTYQTGECDCTIPWAYKLALDSNNTNLQTIKSVTQHADCDANGKTLASKDSAASPRYAPSDASVGSP